MKILTLAVFLIVFGVCLTAKPAKKPDKHDKVDNEIAELQKLIQNIDRLNPIELQKLQDRIDKNLAMLDDLNIDLKDLDDRPTARQNLPQETNVLGALGPYLENAQEIVNNAVNSIGAIRQNVTNLLSNNVNPGIIPAATDQTNILAGINQNVMDFLSNLNVPNVSNVMNLLGQVQRPSAAEFISQITQNVTDFVTNFNKQYNTNFTAASLPSVAEIANNLGKFNISEITNNLNLSSPVLTNLPSVTDMINQLNNITIPRTARASGLTNNFNYGNRIALMRSSIIERLSNFFAELAQNSAFDNNNILLDDN